MHFPDVLVATGFLPSALRVGFQPPKFVPDEFVSHSENAMDGVNVENAGAVFDLLTVFLNLVLILVFVEPSNGINRYTLSRRAR
jgi:hypothetical protein